MDDSGYTPLLHVMPESDSVLLRLISQKLDALIAETHKVNEDHEERIRVLERQVGDLAGRLSVWQIIQTTYTSIIGVIASIIGVRIR